MELPVDPRVREALGLAMKRLASRDLHSGEVAGLLRGREYSELEIGEVLSFLKRHKLLNDEKAIENLIASRSGRRSIGKGKIRAELLKRGVPDDDIEATLGQRTDDEELDAMTAALRSRRWPSDGRLRAARFLIGRGFDPELVERAVESFFGSQEPAGD